MSKPGISTGLTNSKLYQRLNPQKQKVVRDITNKLNGWFGSIYQVFEEFTPHGFDHVLNVIQNIEILLDEILDELDDNQIFCLLLGTIVHDIGMAPKLFENDSMETNDHTKKTLRETHHERSERFVSESPLFKDLELFERQAIGRIAKGHRKVSLYTREYLDDSFQIQNLGFLTASLRLADELEITYERIQFLDAISSRDDFISQVSKESKIHWKSHLSLERWELSDKGEVIDIHGKVVDELGQRGIELVREGLFLTLKDIRGIHFKDDFALPISCVFHLRFQGYKSGKYEIQVDTDVIVNWLIGNLYGKQELWVPLRESVQNSLDACHLRGPPSSKYEPKVIVEIVGRLLVITDNGRGMNLEIIESYLKYLGRSFHKSGDYEHYLENTDFEKPSLVGQFGIGIFSYFILGKSFRIRTRFRTYDSDTDSEWLETRFTRSFCPTFSIEPPLDCFDFGTQVIIELDNVSNLDDFSKYVLNWLNWTFLRPRGSILYRGENEMRIGFFSPSLVSHSTDNPSVLVSDDMELSISAESNSGVFFGLRAGGIYYDERPRNHRSFTLGQDEVAICLEGTYLMNYEMAYDTGRLLEFILSLVNVGFWGSNKRSILVIDFPSHMIDPTLNRFEVSEGKEEIIVALNQIRNMLVNAVPILWEKFRKKKKSQRFRSRAYFSSSTLLWSKLNQKIFIDDFELIKEKVKVKVKDIIDQSAKRLSFEAILIASIEKGNRPSSYIILDDDEWKISDASHIYVNNVLLPGLTERGWIYQPSTDVCPFIHGRTRGYGYWKQLEYLLMSFPIPERNEFLIWYGRNNLEHADDDFFIWIVNEILNGTIAEFCSFYEAIEDDSLTKQLLRISDAGKSGIHQSKIKVKSIPQVLLRPILVLSLERKEYEYAIEISKRLAAYYERGRYTRIDEFVEGKIENLPCIASLKETSFVDYERVMKPFR